MLVRRSVSGSVRPLGTLLFYRRLGATYGRVDADEKNRRTRSQRFIRMGGGRADLCQELDDVVFCFKSEKLINFICAIER